MLWLLIRLVDSMWLVGSVLIIVFSCFGVCIRFMCRLLMGKEVVSGRLLFSVLK